MNKIEQIATAMRSSGDNTPAILNLPKAPTSGGRRSSGTAFVTISIAPENRLALASVTMKLLTPVRVMTNPLSQPSAAPSPSAPTKATGIGSASVCMRKPPSITAHTPMEPTEKFIPPVASTDHLRESDDDVDRQSASDSEKIERRQKARRAKREYRPKSADNDEQDRAEPRRPRR